MTSDEFDLIADQLTVTKGEFVDGRVNVNTASPTVLTALLRGDSAAAEALVTYRQANPYRLASVAWVNDALGDTYQDALSLLSARDYITTRSYQFTADIAAVGPYGRGYRRIRYVFDTCMGSPRVIYRQDLTHLGWALGRDVRDYLLMAKETR